MTNSSESMSKGNEWKQRKLRKSPDRPKIHNVEKEIEIPHDFLSLLCTQILFSS